MRLRQVALVARELEPVVRELCAVLGVEVAYRDPLVKLFGLHTALLPIGETFLEVVSPTQDGTTAGRLLERRAGDGGYMVILQTRDLEAERRRVEALGVRVVWETKIEGAATIHLHPKDLGGAIVSLDVMDPPDSWAWAGPHWKSHVRREVVSEIVAVELQGADPAAMAARWAEVLGRPPAERAGETYRIPLEAGTLRFVPDRDGRGDGVSGLDLRGDAERVLAAARTRSLPYDGDAVQICGTRLWIVAA